MFLWEMSGGISSLNSLTKHSSGNCHTISRVDSICLKALKGGIRSSIPGPRSTPATPTHYHEKCQFPAPVPVPVPVPVSTCLLPPYIVIVHTDTSTHLHTYTPTYINFSVQRCTELGEHPIAVPRF